MVSKEHCQFIPAAQEITSVASNLGMLGCNRANLLEDKQNQLYVSFMLFESLDTIVFLCKVFMGFLLSLLTG